MATTADFRNGLCVAHRGALYTVVAFQHVKPGKGGAFVRTKLKGVVTGKLIEVTFNAGAQIEPVRVVEQVCQFLYKDVQYHYFMDGRTFEQVPVRYEAVSGAAFLKEGEPAHIVFREDTGEPLRCMAPATLWLRVTDTEEGVKGNTVNRATKPAVLETGATIQVPLFVRVGDRVKVDSATGSYLERKQAASR